MTKIQLIRTGTFKDRTLGILLKDYKLLVYTLELADKNNQRNISRIPNGLYKAKKFKSKKYGDCFKVLNVIDRTGILFHIGNYPKDSRGCILVGKSNNHLHQVTSSKDALKIMNEKLPNQFYLEVK